MIADIQEDPCNETLQLVKAAGGEAIFVKCDVGMPDEVEKLGAAALAAYGRIDIAFNNAGTEGTQAVTHECSETVWDKTIGVDLKGTWLCMKMELKHMLSNKGGAIVNCASIAGLVGFEGLPAYVAAKHGVIGLTKTAALEYATKGIRINAVCPGVIHTAMVDRIAGNDKNALKQFDAMEPVGRMGAPEEIAEAVVWLCADAASFVTGVALPVDGGYTAR